MGPKPKMKQIHQAVIWEFDDEPRVHAVEFEVQKKKKQKTMSLLLTKKIYWVHTMRHHLVASAHLHHQHDDHHQQ